MENDLISSAALINEMESHIYWGDSVIGLLEVAKNAPAVDAEPVRHGKWYKPTGMVPAAHSGRHRCSECGYMALYETPGRECLSDYCPSCGAKMDAKEDDDG